MIYQWIAGDEAEGSADYRDRDAILVTYEADVSDDVTDIQEDGAWLTYLLEGEEERRRGRVVEINPGPRRTP